jgi:alpha,alpha-trehalose phosphorylase
MLVRSRRLASLQDRHLIAMDYEVETLDAAVSVTVSSELVTYGPAEASDDPRRGKGFAEKVLRPVAARAAGTRAVLELVTRNSGLSIACGMEHAVDGVVASHAEGDGARVVVQAELEPGTPLRLEKWAIAGRCIRGGRSTAGRRRRGMRPAPRSTTSTPTSPTRSTTTRA